MEGTEDYTISEEDGYRVLDAVIKGPKTLTLVYSIHLLKGTAVWDSVMPDSYTQPEEFIDSDSDEIVKAANNLIGSDDNKTAANIFNYVVNNIKFIRQGESNVIWTASDILKNKKGILPILMIKTQQSHPSQLLKRYCNKSSLEKTFAFIIFNEF